MGSIRRIGAFLTFTTCLAACGPSQAPVDGPDVVYHGGKVFTATESFDVAEAVAVRDGRILAVGSSPEILAMATDATRLIDLQGRTMLPGFFDNHVHAGGGGGSLMEWKGGWIDEVPDWLRGVTTNDDLYAAIRARSAELPAGEWIRGSLSREVWPNQTLPTRWDLDQAAPDRPVRCSPRPPRRRRSRAAR